MLHQAEHPQSVADGRRCSSVRRPARRLDADRDAWASSSSSERHARARQAIPRSHRFVGRLRRILGVPGGPQAAAHAQADRPDVGGSASSPGRFDTPPGATWTAREGYVRLYEEAEAVSRSSVVAAEQRSPSSSRGGGRPGQRRRLRPRTRSRTRRPGGGPRPCVAASARCSAAADEADGDRASARRPAQPPRAADYDITCAWLRPEGLRPGSTAVLRSEGQRRHVALPFVLPPCLRACDRPARRQLGSPDDGVARRRPARRSAREGPVNADRLTVTSYPAGRCGARRRQSTSRSTSCRCTPCTALHDWCFAQVTAARPWRRDVRHGAHHRGRGVALGDAWAGRSGGVRLVVRVTAARLYLEERVGRAYLGPGAGRNAGGVGLPSRPRLPVLPPRPSGGRSGSTSVDARSIALPPRAVRGAVSVPRRRGSRTGPTRRRSRPSTAQPARSATAQWEESSARAEGDRRGAAGSIEDRRALAPGCGRRPSSPDGWRPPPLPASRSAASRPAERSAGAVGTERWHCSQPSTASRVSVGSQRRGAGGRPWAGYALKRRRGRPGAWARTARRAHRPVPTPTPARRCAGWSGVDWNERVRCVRDAPAGLPHRAAGRRDRRGSTVGAPSSPPPSRPLGHHAGRRRWQSPTRRASGSLSFLPAAARQADRRGTGQ